jgi:hemin uptake protein HemP
MIATIPVVSEVSTVSRETAELLTLNLNNTIVQAIPIPRNAAMSDAKPTAPTEHDSPPPRQPVVLDGRQLFGDAREICIELDGVRYRLRITRRNRLILQK